MTESDLDLLARYSSQKAEDAFAEVVRRHLNLVYSAALRLVRSSHLAEEISQCTFLELAQHCPDLKPDTILSAWLYKVAHRLALNVLRRESRRRIREQNALDMNTLHAADSEWNEIAPLLEEAMLALSEADRTAVLLRYFENKPLREVGLEIGVSEDAAQKRITRAVETLRKLLRGRGIAITASSLTVLVSSNAVQAAPVGVINGILSALMTQSAVLHGTAALAKSLFMTTSQKIICSAMVVVAAGSVIHHRVQLAAIRSEQLGPLLSEVRRLRMEADSSSNRLRDLNAELESAQKEKSELLRLRGEMARLREDSQELARWRSAYAAAGNSRPNEMLQAIVGRVDDLKRKLELMPEQKIPEFALLRERDWVDAAGEMKDASDAETRKGMAHLRTLAKNRMARILMKAIQDYTEINSGELPLTVLALQAYTRPALDPEALQRYKLVGSGSVAALKARKPGEQFVLQEQAVLDKDLDARFRIGLEGYGYNVPNGRPGIDRQLGASFDSDGVPGDQP